MGSPEELTVLTYNCGSIKARARFEGLRNELDQLKKFDVLGLAETWIPGKSCAQLDTGYYFHNSGKPGTDGRYSGVGFLLSPEVHEKAEVKFISDRIIQLSIKLRMGSLRITQVYAPQSGHTDDVFDEFLEQLSAAINPPATHEIVLGDFNASPGTQELGELLRCLEPCRGVGA